MADDKHYVGGDWYRICDRTGFKIRMNKTRMEWTERIVRNQSWEPRQPQDLVQGVMDDQSVTDPRPRSINQFQGPLGTTVAVTAVAGGSSIQVVSAKRMFPNDIIGVMLNNGEVFRATVTDVILTDGLLQFVPNLPWSVSVGNEVIDYSAYSPPIITPYPSMQP